MTDRGVRRLLTTVLCAVLALGCSAPAAAPRHHIALRPFHTLPRHLSALEQPPDTATCQRALRISCYSPSQIQAAYGLPALHGQGFDGRGRTIVVVVAFGSPTVENDLRQFDQAFGLPDPPSLRVITPAGQPPAFNGNDPDRESWAAETTLDVEASHLMAPAASILVVATPVSETEGLQGFPEIVRAENYVLDNNLGDVISQSFGATEQTFPSSNSILGLRSSFENAHRRQVTVLAASGDNGATGPLLNGTCCLDHRVTAWPATDPLVTSVGGTQLHLDSSGQRIGPDNVWNDPMAAVGGGQNNPSTLGASGGGVSTVFGRPSFQAGVSGVVGAARGVPDISLSAAVDGALVVYWSFPGRSFSPGFHLIGGTSEATPLLAGLVAIADQIKGSRVGLINTALYSMAGRSVDNGISNVTIGDNDFTYVDSQRGVVTVTGFEAGPDYNLAAGLGTVDANRFCRALAAQAPG